MEWHFRNRISSRFSWINEKVKLPLRERWSITVPGSILSPPIFAEGSIFVSCVEGLYKLSPNNGTILWKIDTKKGKPLQDSPSYYDGKVLYSTSLISSLHCVDAETGIELWKKSVSIFGESPCFYKDKVFLKCTKESNGIHTHGYARYTLDMQEEWFHACEGRVVTNSCAIAEDCLVYSDDKGNVYGLDSNFGTELWRLNIAYLLSQSPRMNNGPGKQSFPYVSEVPVIVGKIVLLQVETPAQTLGLDLKSGEVLWFYKSIDEDKWFYYAQGFDNERWYCVTANKLNLRRYLGININTGQIELDVNISKYQALLGNLLLRTGLVIGKYHFVSIFDPPKIAAFNTITGELEWTFSLDRTKLRGDSKGIYADNKFIWVKRTTGDIYCFE